MEAVGEILRLFFMLEFAYFRFKQFAFNDSHSYFPNDFRSNAFDGTEFHLGQTKCSVAL